MGALARLHEAMNAESIETLLVSEPVNVSWLTGFTGTYGRVIVAPGKTLFITDSRYAIQAQEEVSPLPVATFASPVDGDAFVAQKAREMGIDQIAFESANVTYAAYEKLAQKLDGIKLNPAPDLFGRLRMVKSQDELHSLRQACGLADRAFAHILPLIQEGRTEKDVELDLEFFIRRQGADVAFPSIVVSGERSARPHGHASDKRLERGDFVTLDFGARIDGYNSDITRTVLIGPPTERQAQVYSQVLKAQEAALAAIAPGKSAADVDALARKVLDEEHLARFFGHGLGHGLGRIVHDTGRMNATSEDRFEVGQVWTVEPGVYIEGFGGVRIEDDAVVTGEGIEVLTHAPKHLISLPLK